MAYTSGIRFVETPVFTRRVLKSLSDEAYRGLQFALALRPEQGRLIPGGAGLRKVRWRADATGKRGGVRIIYYWDQAATIYMLYIYRKSREGDLSAGQLRELAAIVRRELE